MFKKLVRNLKTKIKSHEHARHRQTFARAGEETQKLQRMMETINQEGKREISQAQKSAYKQFYRELMPILRLFHFLKKHKRLVNESVLGLFKKIFLTYWEHDKKLQEKFDQPDEYSSKVKNRVSG